MVLDELDRVLDFFWPAVAAVISTCKGKLENFPKNLLP